jgi:hypothetical protein
MLDSNSKLEPNPTRQIAPREKVFSFGRYVFPWTASHCLGSLFPIFITIYKISSSLILLLQCQVGNTKRWFYQQTTALLEHVGWYPKFQLSRTENLPCSTQP